VASALMCRAVLESQPFALGTRLDFAVFIWEKVMLRRKVALGGVLVGALLAVGMLFGEQQAPPSKAKGKLPLYWSKLGLSEEQRKKVAAIQTEYNEKIDVLKRDIKKLENDEAKELNKILTDAQKEELKKIAVSKALNEPPKDETKPKEPKKPGDK
jgi:hypothetical protein